MKSNGWYSWASQSGVGTQVGYSGYQIDPKLIWWHGGLLPTKALLSLNKQRHQPSVLLDLNFVILFNCQNIPNIGSTPVTADSYTIHPGCWIIALTWYFTAKNLILKAGAGGGGWCMMDPSVHRTCAVICHSSNFAAASTFPKLIPTQQISKGANAFQLIHSWKYSSRLQTGNVKGWKNQAHEMRPFLCQLFVRKTFLCFEFESRYYLAEHPNKILPKLANRVSICRLSNICHTLIEEERT